MTSDGHPHGEAAIGEALGYPCSENALKPINATRVACTLSFSPLRLYTHHYTTTKMPHSISPDSTQAEDVSETVSQVDAVVPEPETQDVSMEDAPEPTAAEKPKVNLEDLFDDEDSAEEFPSSAPVQMSQEDASQPAPMYTPHNPPPLKTYQPLTNTPTARCPPNPPSPTPT
jgi:hypothetical protein